VVSKLENKVLHDLSRQLLDNFPGISSIIATIHAGKGNAVRADSTLTLHGQDWFEEELDGLTYRINAFTFFQTNSAQALNLFKTAAELACSFTGNQVECVYDIYAGVGGISLFLARKAKKVLAFEISEESVQSGRFNAMHNNLTNIEFFRADAAELASYNTCSTAEFPDPQIVVVDPPRAGIHPELVKTIIHWQPETLVLVSCNAATLARDMKIFASSGYMPETVLPIDMFPHTYHCEIVVRMALRR
jgi:23S rRNA (uracil1939-C5)-methyltransferase